MVVAKYEGLGDPYVRVRLSDGRVIYEHRFLMEQMLGRRLMSTEHVHHKDGDKRNNELSNLEVLTLSEHSREHAPPPAKTEALICPVCGERFQRTTRYIRSKHKQGHTTFYCSNTCSRTGRAQSGSGNIECRCSVCGDGFAVPANQFRLRMKRSKSGRIACSRSCGKKLGAIVK